MASRYIRNTAVLAKIEATYGTDPTPSAGSNAILVSNVSITPLVSNNVSRDLIRGYMGGSEQLVGLSYVEAQFDVELQNGGTAGTAPAWGPLIRACGYAESLLTTPSRVEYVPISVTFESVTIWYYVDGVLHKLLGCRGTFEVKAGVGERPVLSFRFIGLDGGVSASAASALTLTGFKTPLVVTDTNTADLLLGCTYSAGVLSAGTAYPSRGLNLTAGNDVAYSPTVGGESVEITNRDVTGKLTLELTAAQQVTFMTTVKAVTLQSLGLTHGTTTSYKVMIYAPLVQLLNPKYAEVNGRAMTEFDLRLTPSSGNDELKIILL